MYTYGITTHKDEPIPLVVIENNHQQCANRYRLVLVMRGNGCLVQEDNFKCAFAAPAVLCLNSYETIEWHLENIPFSKEIVFHPLFINPVLDPELLWLTPFLERSKDFHGVLNIDLAVQRRLNGLMELLLDGLVKQPDDYWPCRARSYLLESLLIVDRLKNEINHQENEIFVKSMYDESISKIANYLEQHYNESITINDLTHIFNTNRTTLGKQFKSVYGKSIVDYLIGIRIEIAKALLRDTALSVGEIIARTGFMDVAHFNRTFKSRTGETPSFYRQTRTWL